MNATAVDPYWLAELGPMFFSIKEGHETRAEKRRKLLAQKRKREEAAAEAERREAADAGSAAASRGSRVQRMATPGGGLAGRMRTPKRVGM